MSKYIDIRAKCLIFAVACFLLMELPLLSDVRPIMYDEAWYANTGYNLLCGNGLVNTVVGNGGNANFVMPTMIAGMMSIVGCSLYSIRLAAVFCGLLTLVVLHLIMNFFQSGLYSRCLGYGLFISTTLMNSVFRFGRPEAAALLFVAIGVYAFFRYYENQQFMDLLLLCLSTYLAICSHPFSALLFALLGACLLFRFIRERDILKCISLLLLVLSATLALVSIEYVLHRYNLIHAGNVSEGVIFARVFGGEIKVALENYYKLVFFGKHLFSICIVFIAQILVLFSSSRKSLKALSSVNIIFSVLFPFIFSSDLNMIGMAASYIVLTGIIIIIGYLSEIEPGCTPKSGGVIWGTAMLFCFLNVLVTVFYNYGVKYEKCNSVLGRELAEVIEEKATVFGPLRLWPCVMNTNYYSDHSRYKVLPASFNYILTDSQDEGKYPAMIDVMHKIDNYEIVYCKDTRQYGTIKVYKLKKHEDTVQ